jgi:hypothetical protein
VLASNEYFFTTLAAAQSTATIKAMVEGFSTSFDALGVWRRDMVFRLRRLDRWLQDEDLIDEALADRLKLLRQRLREEKIFVAFVAEFSRGKSELINALFFAGYGRRIMPASAGRTTMCPTELGWDSDEPPGLRLLPIDTRTEAYSLTQWRAKPEAWIRSSVDLEDAGSLATEMLKVAQTVRVTQDRAQALGFWTEGAADNPKPGDDGLIEVPAWRHAIINFPHPLLKQGLVILDTPGLNAIGVEPELTISLIPSAHAVMFILAADTGVTKSDLDVWDSYLANSGARPIVVLNKADTLWDPLSSPEQIEAQIQGQCHDVARLLGVSPDAVVPVSAQKGLVAKVRADEALLAFSGLPALEAVLTTRLLPEKKELLSHALQAGMDEIRVGVSQRLAVKRRELSEQTLELKGLRGKNVSVMRHMSGRISLEQQDFDKAMARVMAVRHVHLKLLRDTLALVSGEHLAGVLRPLSEALASSALKLGVRKVYAEVFASLGGLLQQTSQGCDEIRTMLNSSFSQLNAEFGFTLVAPRELSLARFERDLELVDRNHAQFVSVSQAFRLQQGGFGDKLFRALQSRVRVVFESVASEIELWNKAAAAQLDTQFRERRRNFTRRLDAIERIRSASDSLEDQLSELARQELVLAGLGQSFDEQTEALLAAAARYNPDLNAGPHSGFSSTFAESTGFGSTVILDIAQS